MACSWFPCRVCLTWLCAVLSVVAAGGTAAYQVSFKRIFGDSLRSPIDLGVFMAALGMQIFVVVGSIMWSLISSGVYKLNLQALPYDLLLGTALSSLFFNFVIKFGLSISSPVVVALATQLGIPLNLAIDLLFQGSAARALDPMAIAGVALMLLSFTLSALAEGDGAPAPGAAKRQDSAAPDEGNSPSAGGGAGGLDVSSEAEGQRLIGRV